MSEAVKPSLGGPGGWERGRAGGGVEEVRGFGVGAKKDWMEGKGGDMGGGWLWGLAVVVGEEVDGWGEKVEGGLG